MVDRGAVVQLVQNAGLQNRRSQVRILAAPLKKPPLTRGFRRCRVYVPTAGGVQLGSIPGWAGRAKRLLPGIPHRLAVEDQEDRGYEKQKRLIDWPGYR